MVISALATNAGIAAARARGRRRSSANAAAIGAALAADGDDALAAAGAGARGAPGVQHVLYATGADAPAQGPPAATRPMMPPALRRRYNFDESLDAVAR